MTEGVSRWDHCFLFKVTSNVYTCAGRRWENVSRNLKCHFPHHLLDQQKEDSLQRPDRFEKDVLHTSLYMSKAPESCGRIIMRVKVLYVSSDKANHRF